MPLMGFLVVTGELFYHKRPLNTGRGYCVSHSCFSRKLITVKINSIGWEQKLLQMPIRLTLADSRQSLTTRSKYHILKQLPFSPHQCSWSLSLDISDANHHLIVSSSLLRYCGPKDTREVMWQIDKCINHQDKVYTFIYIQDINILYIQDKASHNIFQRLEEWEVKEATPPEDHSPSYQGKTSDISTITQS